MARKLTGQHSPQAILVVQRRYDVERLRARGLTQQEIADELGVSLATVNFDLAENKAMWLARVSGQREQWIAEQLQALDLIQQLAMEEFAVSRRLAREQTQESIQGDKGLTTKRKTRKKDRIGDSRFLKVATECVEQRREMLGLDLPEQTIDDLDREAQDPLVVEVTTRDAAKMVMSSRDGRVAVRITDAPSTVAPSIDPALTVDALPVEPSPVIGQTVAPSSPQDSAD